MIRKDIINAMYETLVTEDGKPAYTKKELAEVCKAYEETILEKLGQGNDISLSGFANFKIVDKNPRSGFSAITGKPWSTPARKAVAIKPSKVMKDLFA